MTTPRPAVPGSERNRRVPVGRLLFVADAAVADVDELPRAVRQELREAAAVYVLTPSLPGRLAWLADDVDRFRHFADERLDTVLGHMRVIGADATGLAGRGSIGSVIADAVAEFKPDHVLIALRSAEHATWQERRLIEHIEERFHLPVTTYAVDLQGHTPAADGPLLLCYDGSRDARYAIERAGQMFGGRRALVVTVQPPTTDRAGAALPCGPETLVELRTSPEVLDRVVSEGVRVAREAGLDAEATATDASGPVWKTILEIAERNDAAAIIMGSQGLTGVRSRLLGGVATAVIHRASQPTLVVPPPLADK
jgi:nucleotide-binding universal stress UspA family protein